jgi:hypothetical protein
MKRPIAFLADVVARHGRSVDDDYVEIPLSQAELARDYGCSAGTVAYYLHHAGDVVVSRRRQGLVVDCHALEAATGGRSAGRRAGQRHLRVAPDPSSPTPAQAPVLSGDQVVEIISTLAGCLAQMSGQLATAGEQLLATVRGAQSAVSATNWDPHPRPQPANPATLAGGSSYLLRKEALLPSCQTPAAREIRDVEARRPVAGGGEPLPYQRVDELVAPLRALARRTSRPDTLDDNGRAVLAQLSEEQLRQGVLQAQREAADPSVRRPVGLLVHRALSGHGEFFAAPPAPRNPPAPVVEDLDAVAELDHEAVAAVAALEADEERASEELAILDDEVLAWLRCNRAASIAWRNATSVEARRVERQRAWRRLRQRAATEALTMAEAL